MAVFVVAEAGMTHDGSLGHAIRMAEVAAECGPDVPVRYPPLAFCTDNAAMVAGAAFQAIRRGDQAGWETDVHPRLALT